MPTKRQNLYTGRSGQHAVMSVFLFRGYNAAIPEVDVGDDIFVVRDSDGDLQRIQVKAAIAKGKKKHSGRFHVPLNQLQKAHIPENCITSSPSTTTTRGVRLSLSRAPILKTSEPTRA